MSAVWENFVGADHYGGQLMHPGVVDDLRKALATNGQVGVDGSMLIPQSLETTLKITTHKMKELKLWQRIAKRPAYAITEEYNALLDYGLDENGFITEGALPNEDSSTYKREVGVVKFMGTVRAVTHPMTLVRTTIGSAIDQEDANGTMHLLRLLEIALFYGDDRLNPQSFRGFKQIIEQRAPENIIDLGGKPITPAVMEEVDLRIADKFGEIDTLYMSTRAKANMSKAFQDSGLQRLHLPVERTETNLGMVPQQYQGNNSQFTIENHKFIREQVRPKTSIPQALATRVAARPVAPTVAPVVAAGDFSRMKAGTYVYTVGAVNDIGEGLESPVSQEVTLDAGDAVAVTITQVPGARYYRIYRNRAGESTSKRMLLTEVADSNAATTVYTDRGVYIPGCSTAFGLYTDPDQGFCFKQLAPLMKLPLAQINTSMRWAILLYGMLQVYQPRKNIMLINVGDEGMSASSQFEPDTELADYFRGL